MTKIETVVRQVSDLRDFYAKIQQLKERHQRRWAFVAKTAADLTEEERRAFHPAERQADKEAAARWEQAFAVAQSAAALLRDKFGATRVAVFGSVAHRLSFTLWSDIDLAVWGVSGGAFLRAVAAVTGLSPDFEVDLVDMEGCRPPLRQRIEEEGIEL